MDVARPVTGITQPSGLGYAPSAGAPKARTTFAKLVADQIQESNTQQLQADQAVQQLAVGKADNVEDVVLSMVRADLSFRMLLEIRNHVIDAYQEIMRMQV